MSSENAQAILQKLRLCLGNNAETSKRQLWEEVTVQNECSVTFGEASWIDEQLFGMTHRNTHWLQAFHFPMENDTVDEDWVAKDTGVFTFKLSVLPTSD